MAAGEAALEVAPWQEPLHGDFAGNISLSEKFSGNDKH
jgi:hypothetical protein